MRKRLRRRRSWRDERGQVLAIVAGAMVAILGIAAFAIDIGSWYQTKRQAQSAADAAALAAAQDLPSNPATAATDAQTYVTKNLAGATATITTPFGASSSQIQVIVTVNSPSIFGKVLGVTSATIRATSVAQETPGRSGCAAAGAGCFAIFAMDSSCAGNPVNVGGGTHITGGVGSNGSINLNGGGSSFGPTTYGNGSGCTVRPSGYQSQGNSFTSGPTSQAPIATWPIDYAIDFRACAGSACTGPNGTPSFCTQATTQASETLQDFNPVNLTSGNVYCDVGSGTASTPTTWTGSITVNQTGGSAIRSTYVARSVTVGGGSDLTACGYSSSGYTVSSCSAAVPAPATTNYPVIYAVGSATAISATGGGNNFLGDLFAPNGIINIGGGTSTSFLEGQDVIATSGALTGDGPAYSGGAISSSSGSGALVQ